jgi:hypothetical protein
MMISDNGCGASVGGAAVDNAGMLMMVVAIQPSTQMATRPLWEEKLLGMSWWH